MSNKKNKEYTSVPLQQNGSSKREEEGEEKEKDDLSPTFTTSWWGRRTFLEKGLLVLFLLAAIVAVIMIVVAATKFKQQEKSETSSQKQQGVCMSSECVKTSARLLESMDQAVDPCDDFFEYACGSWNRMNVIPDDRANYNTFGKLRDEVQVTMKALLEKPIRQDEPEAIRHTKNLYTSCINITLIEERGDAPLHDFLATLGGWPVLDENWAESETSDWLDLVSKLRLHNNRVLINMWVSADDKNSTANIVQLDQTELGMPSRDYYLKGRTEKTLMAYQQYATDVAIMLGAQEERAIREMEEMVDFEIQLANYTIPSVDRRDAMAIYNKFKVSELYSELSDQIDWKRFLNNIFRTVDIEFKDDDDVIVYAPQFMKDLAELLENTPTRTVTNFVIWRAIMKSLDTESLHVSMRLARGKFQKALYGVDSERARWRTCITYVKENFGMAVGRLFVTEKFDEQAKKNALDMIENIRGAFNELLSEVTWMDSDTRKVAKQKADAIVEKIGYPDYIMNDTALNKDYEGFIIDSDKYFENVINNLRGVTSKDIKKLQKPVDKDQWSTTPAVVNAFYSSTKNQIMFPAGILQPPFYNKYFPKSMNLGGTGMVIGHEITHGFDDKGRQFDKDGNLVQWWSDSVVEAFKGKAQCIIDQYSNYTVEEVDMNINGKQTQGENIADNGGLKQAFRAYRKWVADERDGVEEDTLPGVDLTHNQLFFLNFAQVWCGTARPESYIQSIRSQRHSPGRFRVIGTLSNSYDFAEAYNCPAGSRMNPEHKCVVW